MKKILTLIVLSSLLIIGCGKTQTVVRVEKKYIKMNVLEVPTYSRPKLPNSVKFENTNGIITMTEDNFVKINNAIELLMSHIKKYEITIEEYNNYVGEINDSTE